MGFSSRLTLQSFSTGRKMAINAPLYEQAQLKLHPPTACSLLPSRASPGSCLLVMAPCLVSCANLLAPTQLPSALTPDYCHFYVCPTP